MAKNKRIKKVLRYGLLSIIILYIGACAYMYFMQESFIFLPEKIDSKATIEMGIPTEEINLKVDDAQLNGVLCKVNQSKGLVFFLHGNKGNVLCQKAAAKFYTDLGYDFFTFDYRGFGKSTGSCSSEEQFFEDIHAVYETMAKKYTQDSITVIGYSLGTGPAAMIASKMNPKRLVLIAPYFSLKDMTVRRYYVIPTFLLKYPFETNVHLQNVKVPTLIVHGDQDAVLPFEGGEQLSKLLKKTDQFVRLPGYGHDDMEMNADFRTALTAFLSN
jgi:pimeloyl-ACP methyl ester carboxylesterase